MERTALRSIVPHLQALKTIKNFSKTFEKPLDKCQKVWYNIYVIKRENRGSPYDIKNKKRKEKEGKTTMTNREYLVKVLALANGNEEMTNETNARIKKLDDANAKKKTTQTKTQKENEPIAQAILAALANGSMLGVDLAATIGQTVNKTNGIALTLVNSGVLVKTKTKVKGKGEMTTYALAPTEDEGDEVAEDTATE